jgi:hypothetical protein
MREMKEWKITCWNRYWISKCRLSSKKISIMKTVYTQESNKIMKSRYRGSRTNDFEKPKLTICVVWHSQTIFMGFSIFRAQFLHDCRHPRRNKLLHPFPYANRSLFPLLYPSKVGILFNRKATTVTRTLARISSANAILFYTGIQCEHKLQSMLHELKQFEYCEWAFT